MPQVSIVRLGAFVVELRAMERIRASMRDESVRLILRRCNQFPGKFAVIVFNAEPLGLSPNYLSLTEEQARTLLAEKFRKSQLEIDAIVEEALRSQEFSGC